MHKYLTVIFASLVAFTVKAQQLQSGLLWKISGNGIEKPSYIFGTIHMICPDKFFMPKGTYEMLAATEQVYLEIDMDDPQMMMKAQRLMMWADGKKLKDHMNELDYKAFSEYFNKKTGFNVEMFGSAKPMMFMSLAMMKTAGCSTPTSYEDVFLKKAQNEKKEILGLETLEEQVTLFDNTPIEQQIDWLMDLVKEAENNNEIYVEMLKLYMSQDIAALNKMIAKKMVGMKGMEEEMLDKRNLKWIPIIERTLKEKATFFAVGAGHLGGEKGVLNLLQQKGYKIENLE